MHTLFASYEPEAHGIPPPDAVVRPGSAQDAEQTGRLAAYREGEPTERLVGIHHRKVSNEDNCLVVAELDGRVVGFGWASYLRPVESGGHGAPDGWYLSGSSSTSPSAGAVSACASPSNASTAFSAMPTRSTTWWRRPIGPPG